MFVWFHCRGFSRYASVLFYTRQHAKNNRTVADIFQQTVSKHPDKIAVRIEQKKWTFREVEEYSNRIANYFKSQGYQKGDVVALLLDNSPEFICVWLGLSKLGVITALLNTNLRLDSLWHCISVATVKGIIFGTDFSGNLQNFIVTEFNCLLPKIVNCGHLTQALTG